MLNLICENTNNGSGQWTMLIILAVLFVVMMLFTIIPQRKRKKEAQQMMQSVRVGKKIRTIGGFVGEIVSLDNKNGTMELNVGSKESPVIVVMDQGAIGTVLNPDVPQPADAKQEVVAEENGAPVAVTADDAAEDEIQAEKAAEKTAKKNAKKKAKAEKKAAEVSESAEGGESADVTADAPVVDAVVEEAGKDSEPTA